MMGRMTICNFVLSIHQLHFLKDAKTLELPLIRSVHGAEHQYEKLIAKTAIFGLRDAPTAGREGHACESAIRPFPQPAHLPAVGTMR